MLAADSVLLKLSDAHLVCITRPNEYAYHLQFNPNEGCIWYFDDAPSRLGTSSQINALVIIVAKGHRTLGTLSLSRLDLRLHAFAAKDVIAFRNDSVL